MFEFLLCASGIVFVKLLGWVTPQGNSLGGLLHSETHWLGYFKAKLFIWFTSKWNIIVGLLQSKTLWLVYITMKLLSWFIFLIDTLCLFWKETPWLVYVYSRAKLLGWFTRNSLLQSDTPWLVYFTETYLPQSETLWLAFRVLHTGTPWLIYFEMKLVGWLTP